MNKNNPQSIYFEDMPVGQISQGGEYLVTEEEVIEFGTRFDPLPIHVDAEAAKVSPFGGLIAAGTHILAIAVNLNHQLMAGKKYHYIAALGFDSIRFQSPARVGDTLSLKEEIKSATQSRSKPDQGIIESEIKVLNQHNETVVVISGKALMECRPAANK